MQRWSSVIYIFVTPQTTHSLINSSNSFLPPIPYNSSLSSFPLSPLLPIIILFLITSLPPNSSLLLLLLFLPSNIPPLILNRLQHIYKQQKQSLTQNVSSWLARHMEEKGTAVVSNGTTTTAATTYNSRCRMYRCRLQEHL